MISSGPAACGIWSSALELTARRQRPNQGPVSIGGGALRALDHLPHVPAEVARHVQDEVLDQVVPSVCDRGHVRIGLAQGAESRAIANRNPAAAHVVELDDPGSAVGEVADQLAEDVSLVGVLHAAVLLLELRFG